MHWEIHEHLFAAEKSSLVPTLCALHKGEFHRATMAFRRPGGEFIFTVYFYRKMTPPRNLGRVWLVFGGWSQIRVSLQRYVH